MRPLARAPRALDLDRLCRRALARAARSASSGNRRAIRAAASRFVRRHRRASGYLRWVVRSVAANASLACALLGLAPSGAAAHPTLFDFPTDAANPLAAQVVGSFATPALGDLDRDGDLDLVAGAQDGTFSFFANTGSATSPAFVQRTGAANPFGGIDLGFYSIASLADLDGDGDLDFVAGAGASGGFAYYANTGSAASPAFVQRTGAANPLGAFSVGSSAAPAFGDLDGDGDLDLVAGEFLGALHFFENTGQRTAPAFVERTGLANPVAAFGVAAYSKPALADLDADGDLDLVVGEFSGALTFVENTGFVTTPRFASRTGDANPLAGQDVGFSASPAAGDLDGDGDLDLVVGTGSGSFAYDRNLAGAFVRPPDAADPLTAPPALDWATPALVDLDRDGDLDVVAGDYFGTLAYFENTGSSTRPAYVRRTGGTNPLPTQDFGSISDPALADLDGDGDLDLVVGENAGAIFSFVNSGTATAPVFVLQTGAANPFASLVFTTHVSPTFGDLDGDGDFDLVSGGNVSNAFAYYENTGSRTSAAFVQRVGTGNPFAVLPATPLATPALGDYDVDGDLDLVWGSQGGELGYAENVGPLSTPAFVVRSDAANPLADVLAGSINSPAAGDLDGDGDLDLLVGWKFSTRFFFVENLFHRAPSFTEVTGSRNPLDGTSGGSTATPALGDLDGDGDLDLVAGEVGGFFRYFANTRTANQPAYVRQTGAANPLAGQDVGFASTPALGDLDGDGDLDLVAGEANGSFRFYANTGDARLPAFVLRTGAADPLLGIAGGYNPAPALADLDADGDLDLVSGDYDGVLRYFENTGSATSPTFAARTGIANPLDGRLVGYLATVALGDADEDGDLDLVTGEQTGGFHYFENTGSAKVPAFVEQTGSNNPLAGRHAIGGMNSAPALGDVDHDGDLDLITGSGSGAFATFLPEPIRGAMLASGIVLLRGLEALRTRRRRGDSGR